MRFKHELTIQKLLGPTAALMLGALLLVQTSVGQAETWRWRKWEIERNEMLSDSNKFQALPSAAELAELQPSSILRVLVPSSAVHILANSQGQELKKEFIDPLTGEVSFFIHPQSQNLFEHLLKGHKVESVPVEPTTSPRTVFWQDVNLKLSLSQKVNGALRTVYPLQMERALAISEMLAKDSQKQKGFENFGFLPEVLGIYDAKADSPFGFLVRQIPLEILHGVNSLAPLTAYCAKDPKGSTGSLLAMDAKLRGLSPAEHVKKNILPAIIKAFAAAGEIGIALEAHQQNLLLEIDPQGRFTGRVYFRDMDGARVDFELRRKRGLSTEALKKVSQAEWVFELERMDHLRQSVSVPKSRPAFWSGVVEQAYQVYLLGSSVFLLENAVQAAQGKMWSWRRFSLKSAAEQELQKLSRDSSGAPACLSLFR